MSDRTLCVFSLALVVLGTHASHAAADVIAEEPFAYGVGSQINGMTGGTGWAGGWITGQAGGFTSTSAIAGGPAIGATGGAMQITSSGRIFRVIDVSPSSAAAHAGLVASHSAMFFGTRDGIGAPGTTVWVGVLVTGGDGNSGDETQYHFYDGARTDSSSLALGDQNKDGEVVAMLRGGNVADWGFERTCNHSTCVGSTAGGFFATSPAVPFGGTHWSVTRFVFGATTTQITMWRDPTPGAADPADASALLLSPFGGGGSPSQTVTVPALFFDTIAPNASGNFGYQVDEIRIATTFAELSHAGGPPPDAGMSMSVDAGAAVDAALLPGVDAGTMSGADAARTGGDGGSSAPASSGGCGCRMGRAPHDPALAMLTLAIVFGLARRRSITRR